MNSKKIDAKVRLTGVKSLPRTFQDTIIAGEGLNARTANSLLGTVAAIDGNTAVVGVPGQTFNASGADSISGAGSAYVFERTEEGWNMLGRLTAETFPGARVTNTKFGSSVDVSGYTVVVGAPYQDFKADGSTAVSNSGAVFIFRREASSYTFVGRYTAPGTNQIANASFGASVAIDDRSSYIVVGAPNESSNRGAAYIFSWDGANLTLQNKFIGQESSNLFVAVLPSMQTTVRLVPRTIARMPMI